MQQFLENTGIDRKFTIHTGCSSIIFFWFFWSGRRQESSKEEQTASGSRLQVDELEEEARENVTSPENREELGASEAFLKTHTTIQKHSVCFASFSFWSRSCPYILDSLVVPIRSDQDNKVETCLLKQSNSLLSRPTQTMNRNLTRKAGAWTDLLPKGWMLSFWTAFHHHHILIP